MEELIAAKAKVIDYISALDAPSEEERELHDILSTDSKTILSQDQINLMLKIWDSGK